MYKFNQLSLIFYGIHTIILIVILGCAAQGPAGGGPVDADGPQPIKITPKNNSVNISVDTYFIVEFNELIDPLSVPSSVSLIPEIATKIKVRKNKIIITPKQPLPPFSVIRLDISRRVRDYRSNELDAPINLVYSTGKMIPTQSISGQLINSNPEMFNTLGLFHFPVVDTASPIFISEADKFGIFTFNNISSGKFTIAAVEGGITDFHTQIRKLRYGMLSDEFLQVGENDTLKDIYIVMSDPIQQLEIKTIEFQNSLFGELTYSDGTTEPIIIPRQSNSLTENIPYSPGDTVAISLEKSNRLENYFTPEYKFILPDILDTVPPEIVSTEFTLNGYQITFSEPVQFGKETKEDPKGNEQNIKIIGFTDLDSLSLNYTIPDPLNITVTYISDTVTKIKIPGYKIQDIFGNMMKDSVVTISLNRESEFDHTGGNIRGEIHDNLVSTIMIEAVNIESDEKFYVRAENDVYEFINLPQGEYEIRGFEILNDLDERIYFSGIWSPYRRAAKFGIHPDPVEVRARWVIEGINIEIE